MQESAETRQHEERDKKHHEHCPQKQAIDHMSDEAKPEAGVGAGRRRQPMRGNCGCCGNRSGHIRARNGCCRKQSGRAAILAKGGIRGDRAAAFRAVHVDSVWKEVRFQRDGTGRGEWRKDEIGNWKSENGKRKCDSVKCEMEIRNWKI